MLRKSRASGFFASSASASHLKAGRPAAHDEVEEAPLALVRLRLGLLEGEQDLAAQEGRVVHLLEPVKCRPVSASRPFRSRRRVSRLPRSGIAEVGA
jgi:hypothetical protein